MPVDLQSLLGSASYWTLADVRAHAAGHGRAWWTLTPFVADAELVIEDDDAEAEEPPEAPPLSDQDLRREEDEMRQLERKKRELEDRVHSMSRDISGLR